VPVCLFSPLVPPLTISMKSTIPLGAGYKIISSGTNNRSVSIVSGPIQIASAGMKENHVSPLQRLEDDLKRSSRYPVIPGLPIKPKLRRQHHVKKHLIEDIPEEEVVVVAESPVRDRESTCLTPTQANSQASPPTPAWARPTQPQRYPSSIFEDYFNEGNSALDSPIHTIEDIVVLKEHEAWGGYWNDKMDGRAVKEPNRPALQRAGTLEVAELLRNRRLHANDYRSDSLASLREDGEL
jgi:hypothetical protein